MIYVFTLQYVGSKIFKSASVVWIPFLRYKKCVFGSEGMEYGVVMLLRSSSTFNLLFLPICGVMSLPQS